MDKNQASWRIFPKELMSEIVAENSKDYFQLVAGEEFQVDWEMSNPIELARKNLGNLKEGWVYELVVPGMFGGKSDTPNIHSVPLEQLVKPRVIMHWRSTIYASERTSDCV